MTVSLKARVAALGVGLTALIAPVALTGAAQGAKAHGDVQLGSASPALLNCGGATVSTGSGASLNSYCVSSEGNIAQFKQGTSGESINVGRVFEGYSICYPGGAPAWDVIDTAGGLTAATITSHSPLTIVRKTLDGKLSLSQQFFTDTQHGGVRINMTLTNLSAATLTGVKLSRLADFDANGSFTNDAMGSLDSETQTAAGSGVVLRNLTFGQVHATTVESFSLALVGSPATCAPVTPAAATNLAGDFAARMDFTVGTIQAGKSKLVKVAYYRA